MSIHHLEKEAEEEEEDEEEGEEVQPNDGVPSILHLHPLEEVSSNDGMENRLREVWLFYSILNEFSDLLQR